MADEMNVSSNYFKLHTFFGEKDQIVKGKSDFFSDKKRIEISMFSKGVTSDGRKWIADDGYVNVFDKNGNKKKIRRITVDKNNDGFADTYLKVRTLQNGKAKEHKTKYNSEYVDKKLAEYMSIGNTEKRQKKLNKLRNKLLKAGVSEEAIDKKFNSQNNLSLNIHSSLKEKNFSQLFLGKQIENTDITKEDAKKMIAETRKQKPYLIDKSFKEMTNEEKYTQAKNLAVIEKSNKSEARKLLLDPNLQEYYKQNPRVFEIVIQMAS